RTGTSESSLGASSPVGLVRARNRGIPWVRCRHSEVLEAGDGHQNPAGGGDREHAHLIGEREACCGPKPPQVPWSWPAATTGDCSTGETDGCATGTCGQSGRSHDAAYVGA